MKAVNEKALKKQFRKTELGWEEQIFLRILSTLGLSAWLAILWVQAFPFVSEKPPMEEPIRVAQVLIKPPPPPEPKKEEPKPEPVPLPPRKQAEKPGPAPGPIAKAPPKRAAQPGSPIATAKPKRSVASLGLLSMLSSAKPRSDSSSQRIGEVLRNVDFREAKDLSEDMGSLTGTVGARGKASVGEMVAGLPRGSGTQVSLSGSAVTPIAGPGGGASVSGSGGGVSGRTLAEIRDIVASYVAGLKYLYDRELKQRPSLHGKVTVAFVVTGPGSVAEVRLVSSGLGHPGLESAILGRIRGWKFPAKPADSTKVTFPFDFVAPTG